MLQRVPRLLAWTVLLWVVGCGQDPASEEAARAQKERLRIAEGARKAQEEFEEHLRQAQAELAQGHPAVAVEQLEKALRIQASPRAIELFTQARKEASSKAQRAGRELLESGDYAGANTRLQEAIRFGAGDKDTADLLKRANAGLRRQHVEAGRSALKAGRYEDAVQAFGRAQKLAADAAVAALLREAEFPLLLQKGRRNMEEKKFAAAVLSLEAALARKAQDPEALKLLDEARKKKAAQEEEEYQRAMAEGDAAMEKKNWQAAITAFTMALAKNPSDTAALDKRTKAQRSLRDATIGAATLPKELIPSKKPNQTEPEGRGRP
jgi:tetratricopeptide (TPR) repeat protein